MEDEKEMTPDEAQKEVEKFDKLRKRLTRLAKATLGHYAVFHDGEDCFQEALELMLKKLNKGETIKNQEAWLYRTTRLVASNRRREYIRQASQCEPLEMEDVEFDKDSRFGLRDHYEFDRPARLDELDIIKNQILSGLAPDEQKLYRDMKKEPSPVELAKRYGVSVAVMDQRLFRLKCHIMHAVEREMTDKFEDYS